MDDIAPELYERLKAEYERRRGSAADAAEKAKGYRDVLSWADHAGRSAALTFDGILPEELPGGRMYFNIAERTLRPVLEEVAADVLTVAEAAQRKLNAAAGIEMAFQTPDEGDKIDGLINQACAGPTWEDRRDMFRADTLTFARKVSDDCIRENAGRQYDAGMEPQIIRTAGSAEPCPLCSPWIGTFDYSKAKQNPEIFARHRNCTCIVEYVPRKGLRQNVHTKQWNEQQPSGSDETSTPAESKEIKPKRTGKDVTGEYLRKATPGKGRILIEPGAQENEDAQDWEDSVNMANWLLDHFGGEIVIRKRGDKGQKEYKLSPDYRWDGKLWDLKTQSTEKSPNSAIKHGKDQIQIGPEPAGGIILNYTYEVDLVELIERVDMRMGWYRFDPPVDVMVVVKGELRRVLRYK